MSMMIFMIIQILYKELFLFLFEIHSNINYLMMMSILTFIHFYIISSCCVVGVDVGDVYNHFYLLKYCCWSCCSWLRCRSCTSYGSCMSCRNCMSCIWCKSWCSNCSSWFWCGVGVGVGVGVSDISLSSIYKWTSSTFYTIFTFIISIHDDMYEHPNLAWGIVCVPN